MDWENQLNSENKDSDKNQKNRKRIAAREQNDHNPQSECLFERRFLILLEDSSEKKSRRKHWLFRYTSCFGLTKITASI